MDKSLKILSDIVIFNKYAKFVPSKGRRETFREIMDRNKAMHIKHYPMLKDEINSAYEDFVMTKKVLPSMRSAQFAGKPVEVSPNRLYNCAYLPVDDYRAFSETMFLLLGGSGVGFSVQSHHVESLPPIRKPLKTRRFLIEDSISGWADAVKVLLRAYMYSKSAPKFDFSDIREKGAPLITSGGKAPGAEPLKTCLYNLKTVLDRKNDGDCLTSLEVHDMMCYIADAVLAGGIRRAAMISLFDMDNEEMLTCKSGTWWETNPQRGRANNSAILLRHKITRNEFLQIMQRVEASRAGEPGVIFSNNKDMGYNPCITGDTLVAVADGRNAVPIKDLVGSTYPVYAIKDKKTVIKQSIKTWKTRENAEIWKLTLDDGSVVRATPDHQMMLRDGTYCALKDLVPGVSLMPFNSYVSNNGYRQISSNTGRDRRQYRLIAENNNLIVNAKETAIHHADFNSLNDCIENLRAMPHAEHRELHAVFMRGPLNAVFRIKDRNPWRDRLSAATTGKRNPKYSGVSNDDLFKHAVCLSRGLGRGVLSHDWLVYAKENKLPRKFSDYRQQALGSIKEMCVKAAGVAGVEYCEKRIRRVPLKAKTVKIKKPSMRAHNRKTKVDALRNKQLQVFSDLQYELQCAPYKKQCAPYKKQWEQSCKENNISSEICRKTSPFMSWKKLKEVATTYNHKVASIEFIGYEDVYDMTVEDVHNFGIITSSEDDKHITSSGIFIHNCVEASLEPYSFCNLCDINFSDVVDQVDLEARSKAAAFIGTLQAGYTDFHYLRDVWKRTTERDALIGVGGTGIASGAVLSLDLTAAVEVIKEENARVAKIIGINKAARCTVIKPSGTTSIVLGTASGIHAAHDPYFIRRMRMGKNEALYKHMAKYHPELVVDDLSQPSTGAILEIPIKATPGSIFRDESAIDLLERVKKFSIEWIKPGHRKGDNRHNVSATISIKDNEWGAVAEWMWANREHFNGLSVLNHDGGSYSQAPFQSITSEEYYERYKALSDIDLTKVREEEDFTEHGQEIACSGGKCEL